VCVGVCVCIRSLLTKEGFQHHDLFFNDCTPPPDDIADSFLRLVESQEAGVAVHCRAGLGRTGTLIALYLVKYHAYNNNNNNNDSNNSNNSNNYNDTSDKNAQER
jgi:protein-tyrosine phosphatase